MIWFIFFSNLIVIRRSYFILRRPWLDIRIGFKSGCSAYDNISACIFFCSYYTCTSNNRFRLAAIQTNLLFFYILITRLGIFFNFLRFLFKLSSFFSFYLRLLLLNIFIILFSLIKSISIWFSWRSSFNFVYTFIS
jgi:hypothetical protein